MAKRPLKLSTILKLNTTLQRYKKEADANRFFGGKPGEAGAPFRNHPPEVQKLAWEHLSYLCVKHKDKLKANYQWYYRVLVATATRLALDELGITQISRKGACRSMTMHAIRVRTRGKGNAQPTPDL